MKNKEELRTYKRDWARKKRGSTIDSLYNSQTFRGRRSELLALKILTGSIDCNDEKMNNPGYDLLWNNHRIDVKSCELYKRKMKRGKPVTNCGGWWTFNRSHCFNKADYYFCVCLINDKPVRYYLVPALNLKGFTIGLISKKFDKYLIQKND